MPAPLCVDGTGTSFRVRVSEVGSERCREAATEFEDCFSEGVWEAGLAG